MRQSPARRGGRRAAIATAVVLLALVAVPSAGAVSLSAGDVVVYRVGNGSEALTSSSTSVHLDELEPNGVLAGTVDLPTVVNGSNRQLVASGSAASEGLLTLSSKAEFLLATGYAAALGTKNIAETKANTTPRTVGEVNANGEVNTSTALSDFADQNNPRSAVSTDGKKIWLGGAGKSPNAGIRFTELGKTTSTLLNENDTNVRQVEIFDEQLYVSADPTKGLSIATVGTGLPTSVKQTVTNLPFATAPEEPYAYAFLTLGSGGAPDTVYVADNKAGAVEKYGLLAGSWTLEGSVEVPFVTGVTARDQSGVVTIYATSSGSNSREGTLYKISDVSGQNGVLSGIPVEIATAPPNEAYRGVAFAPGTPIGSGGTPPAAPTIAAAERTLPAAIGDPTNKTLSVTVGGSSYSPSQLTVTVRSSDQTVAPDAGISVSGSGAERTITVTPASVGTSKLTLTAEAPDGSFASTQVNYGASAEQGNASDRYYAGAGNASTAIDVGGGYMILGDDETNVLHLYHERTSSEPVKSFDFTSQLPDGATEIDIEASARAGNTLYWLGSMSNKHNGELQPGRDVLFAATISGSGANTELSYLGSYTHLREDLIEWDNQNGRPLGFAQSAEEGASSDTPAGFNVEGLEFAPGSNSTAYLAFRAPLEPPGENRNLALLVPVTNLSSLVTNGNPGSTKATFGTPLEWNLGGLAIREIRRNADGEYLVIAGSADESDAIFDIYGWDGETEDEPVLLNGPFGLVAEGAWEDIVSVPDPITDASQAELLEDNGDTVWYENGQTTKKGLAAGLQKDLGRLFSLQIPAPGVSGAPHQTSGANPNTGAFTLRWKPAATIGARFLLQHQNAQGAWTNVASGLAQREYAFTPGSHETEGTWSYRVIESNPTGEASPSSSSETIKVDRTPPAPPTATAARPPDYAGGGGWYKDSVTVSFSSNGDPLLADGSTPSGVDPTTLSGPQTFETSGSHTASGTLADKVGNVSAPGTLIVQVDTTAPALEVQCPATALVGEAGVQATVSASDGESGLASDPSGTVPISTAQAGQHTVTRTAIDNVGHETTRSCTTEVRYPTPGAPTLSAGANPNDNGLFTLSWSGADPMQYLGLGYTLEHRSASGPWTTVATGIEALSYEFGGPGESEGTWEYRLRGVDESHGQTTEYSPASAPVVVDRTRPATPAAKASRAVDYAGNGGWYKDSVTVSFTAAGDPALADGSPGSGVEPASLTGPQTFHTSGVQTASGTVADKAGNVSLPGTLTVRVDATAPTLNVSCPATASVGQEGVVASVVASDGESGLASDPTGTVAIATAHAGPVTVTRTAVDNVGHETTRSCTTQVLESPPELGRCQKLAAGEPGGFSSSKCTQQLQGGKYEWLSGTAATGIATSGAGATLETAGGERIVCGAQHGSGTITTAKTLGGVVLRFTGCEMGAKKCTTTGRPAGEIETKQLEGQLGWLSQASHKAGLALRPTGGKGAFAEYFCGSSLFTLSGGVTAPIKTDKMATSQVLKYKGKRGVQKPAGLEGEPQGLTSTPFGETPEAAALTETVTATFPEALELNTAF